MKSKFWIWLREIFHGISLQKLYIFTLRSATAWAKRMTCRYLWLLPLEEEGFRRRLIWLTKSFN